MLHLHWREDTPNIWLQVATVADSVAVAHLNFCSSHHFTRKKHLQHKSFIWLFHFWLNILQLWVFRSVLSQTLSLISLAWMCPYFLTATCLNHNFKFTFCNALKYEVPVHVYSAVKHIHRKHSLFRRRLITFMLFIW